MKIIGKMADGSELLSVSEKERCVFERSMQMLGDLGFQPDAPAPVAAVKKPVAGEPDDSSKLPAAPAAVGKKFGVRRVICKNCGKQFLRPANSRRSCCTENCTREFDRKYAQKWYAAKKPAASVAPAGKSLLGRNPADPLLSDDEREALKAERLKLIKAAAERHQ